MSIELILVIIVLARGGGDRHTAQGPHGLFRPMVVARQRQPGPAKSLVSPAVSAGLCTQVGRSRGGACGAAGAPGPCPLLSAVDLRDVHKHFGSVQAVRGVALSIGSGEVMAFLGPNGAGKTSTIDMILGLSRPARSAPSTWWAPSRTRCRCRRICGSSRGSAYGSDPCCSPPSGVPDWLPAALRERHPDHRARADAMQFRRRPVHPAQPVPAGIADPGQIHAAVRAQPGSSTTRWSAAPCNAGRILNLVVWLAIFVTPAAWCLRRDTARV